MKIIVFFLALFTSFLSLAQYTEEPAHLLLESGDTLFGTMTLPEMAEEPPVVLIISGSGPTDRDGNSPMMQGKNNSLQMVAHQLAEAGIASVRYDKRGIAASQAAATSEEEMVFDDFVGDAAAWLRQIMADQRLGAVFVAGHSEGSLVGMLAAKELEEDMAGYISIAGMGRPIDTIIVEQIGKQAPFLVEETRRIFAELKTGARVDTINPMLMSLFRPSIQPYLINLLKHQPAEILASLDLPTLIVQGSHDIQVLQLDAERLAAARPGAELLLIEGMNHVLKDAPAERFANIAAYSDPELPLSEGLMEGMVAFIRAHAGSGK